MAKNPHAVALGRRTSKRKATSSAANGRLGGRPRKDPVPASMRELETITSREQTTIDVGDFKKIGDGRWYGGVATPWGLAVVYWSRGWVDGKHDHVMAHFIWRGRAYSRGWTERRRLTRTDIGAMVGGLIEAIVVPTEQERIPT